MKPMKNLPLAVPFSCDAVCNGKRDSKRQHCLDDDDVGGNSVVSFHDVSLPNTDARVPFVSLFNGLANAVNFVESLISLPVCKHVLAKKWVKVAKAVLYTLVV